MAYVLRSIAEFREALRREDACFQVEKAGALYDIGIAEGGEKVCAWPAHAPEDAKSVARFGSTSPWTGIPEPEVAEAIAAWLDADDPFGMDASRREEEGAEAAGPDYTGLPCTTCGRIRVYLRRDGRYICEKCESFNPAL